jgi:hypothetical protein
MQASDQFHTPVALLLWTASLTAGYEAKWAVEPIWTQVHSTEILFTAEITTHHHEGH